jgi:hypothetical protein
MTSDAVEIGSPAAPADQQDRMSGSDYYCAIPIELLEAL